MFCLNVAQVARIQLIRNDESWYIYFNKMNLENVRKHSRSKKDHVSIGIRYFIKLTVSVLNRYLSTSHDSQSKCQTNSFIKLKLQYIINLRRATDWLEYRNIMGLNRNSLLILSCDRLLLSRQTNVSKNKSRQKSE